MKRLLVVYYTQSGQLKQIIDNVLAPVSASDDIVIDYEELKPIPEFPFPWGKEFYDCFPESVKGIPCKLAPLSIDKNTSYDLIILAYQPWYLSPSVPFTAFLKSEEAKTLLEEKPVITIIGSRNMWTRSQEIVKDELHRLKAKLVGNIVLADRTINYIAGFTIIKWLGSGHKKAGILLPEAGVSEKDIRKSERFGTILLKHITKNDYKHLQKNLIDSGAVRIQYHLVNIEINARKIFDIFAGYILRKGNAGEKERKGRIMAFKIYLLFVFFILSPFFSFIFMLKRYLLFPVANRKIAYYKNVSRIDK